MTGFAIVDLLTKNNGQDCRDTVCIPKVCFVDGSFQKCWYPTSADGGMLAMKEAHPEPHWYQYNCVMRKEYCK